MKRFLTVLVGALALAVQPVSAGQIDSILGYPDLATAKLDAVVVAQGFSVNLNDWTPEHAMVVIVKRVSTGVPLAGVYVLISTSQSVPALLNDANLKIAIDRDKANARQPGFVLRQTVGGILQDVMVTPVYQGSDYPWGGLQ